MAQEKEKKKEKPPVKSRPAYCYSPITCELVAQTKAYIDPVCSASGGKENPDFFAVPACSTLIKPPKTAPNEIAVWDWKNKKWKKSPDYRGQTFFDPKAGASIKINVLGAIPKRFIKNFPPSPYHTWDEKHGEYQFTDIDGCISGKFGKINAFMMVLHRQLPFPWVKNHVKILFDPNALIGNNILSTLISYAVLCGQNENILWEDINLADDSGQIYTFNKQEFLDFAGAFTEHHAKLVNITAELKKTVAGLKKEFLFKDDPEAVYKKITDFDIGEKSGSLIKLNNP